MKFRRHALLLRDAMLVAAVALATLQALRTWVCDRYIVPTGSMEPTLHGDPEHGDVVLVDKLARSSGLRRGDLAVVRCPGSGQGAVEKYLVKRVAALGNDWVDFRDGDLWLGPTEQLLQRVVKHPLDDADLRVPWFEWPVRGSDEAGRFLALDAVTVGDHGLCLAGTAASDDELLAELRPEARARRRHGTHQLLPPGCFGTVRSVDGSYLDAVGHRGAEGETVLVNDFGLTLWFGARLGAGRSPVTGLLLCLELRPHVYAWLCSGDQVQFCRDGERTGPPIQSQDVAGVAEVTFGILDGRCFLAFGEQLVDWPALADGWQDQPLPAARPEPKSLAYFACRGGGTGIRRLQVFRDLWQFRRPVPLREHHADEVPPGYVYLLGDNSFDSSDSRTNGPYSLQEFIGRPRCVLGPRARARWLRR
ncbi:MAG TPA: signal peptidase I [Planctomycetota bacterium]|nr:signal peptidase I [Planctomycetota bacterium]